MPAANLAPAWLREPGLPWVVEDGGTVVVDQAHANVDAVADTPRVRHRREASPVAEPAGHLADDLPEGGGPVGSREAIRRVARDLELPETIFREEDLWLEPGLPQRGHRQRAEGLDEPLGLVREARPRAEVRARSRNSCSKEATRRSPVSSSSRTSAFLRKRTGAGIPGAAVGVGGVAEKEVQRRDIVPEIYPCFGGAVGQETQIPERPHGFGSAMGPKGVSA